MAHFGPADIDAEATRPPVDAPLIRTNKYAATCANCQQRVEPNAGILIRGESAWVVTHVQPCPEAPEDAPAPTNYNEILTKGTYTVVLDGTHTTIKIVRQAEDDDFMPGLLVIGYLSGSNNETDYTNFANVRSNGVANVWTKHRDNERLADVMRTLVGNIPAAREAYAIESSRCSYCNRKLTVPASVNQGLGPECARKV